jgi:hypothetical protein
MRNTNIFNIGTKVLAFAFMLVAILCTSLMMGAAGVTMAVGAAVTGSTDGTGTVTTNKVNANAADLDMEYVSKLVTEMRPAATPLDTIMRQIRKATPIKSWKTEYYAVDSRPLYDTVKTAYTKADDGHTSIDLAVNNISTFTADENVMIKGITGVDSKDLVCFVISKDVSAGTIKLQPLNGTAGSETTEGSMIIPASIPVGTRIVRVGPCKDELAAQTSPYAILPAKSYNYVQRFMAQVEESIFQRDHAKEVDWSFTDYEAQNILDMKNTMEMAYLFGVRAQFTDLVNSKERYATGGTTRFISKAIEYGLGGTDRTIDNAWFVDATKSIFSGNSGSEVRYLFGGNGLMANLMKVDTVIKQIQGKQTMVKYGLTFKEIETNFGLLRFFHHPGLDQAGWDDNGIVLDLAFIEKHTWKPLSTTTLDLKKSGQRNADAVVIEETSGIVTRYPDTHAIIRPKA